MPFLTELKIFITNLLAWLGGWFVLALVFFVWPFNNSLAVQTLSKIKIDLLPTNVQLIVTNPLSAFLTQMIIALLLAFIFTLPIFLYGLIRYLAPALVGRERRALGQVLLPSFLLFLGGCLFAYLFLIPATLKILYPYATDIGVTPFFALNEFVTLVFSLMIATGALFLLPVFMFLLSWAGLIRASFWRQHWRYAFLFFLIFSAIITPDGTGITMAMLCLPLMGLYLLGYVIIKMVERKRLKKINS